MKQRIFCIDLLRVIAMLLVLVDHTIVVGLDAGNVICRYLVTGNGVLFFMISGALLLPVEVSGSAFLLKRFKRILLPFVTWSIAYLLLAFYSQNWTVGKLWQEFYSLPLKQSFGAAWFMYILIGLYLIAPIISVWLRNSSRRWVEYFLVLWGLSTMIPYASFFVEFPQDIHDSMLSPFVGYLGYMILGYYLWQYPLQKESCRYQTVAWVTLLLLAVALPIRLYFFTEKYGLSYMLYDDEHINIVAFMAIVFVLVAKVKHMPHFIEVIVGKLAKLSYGIYLCHMAVFQYVMLPHFGYGWLSFVATLIVSTLIIYLLSLTPIRKYIN